MAKSAMTHCSQEAMKENNTLLEITQNPNDLVSTEKPNFIEDGPTEDYPEYTENDDVTEAKQKFYDTLLNVEEICYVNGKNYIKGLVTGEGQTMLKTDDVNVATLKERGVFFCDVTLNASTVQLTPTCDFKHTLEPQSVVLCAISKNIFWWFKHEKLVTPIAMVMFNEQESSHFKHHYQLVLNIKNKINITEFYEDEFVYKGLSVYRIIVLGSYTIMFHNITNQKYKVIINIFILNIKRVFRILIRMSKLLKLTARINP
ncbi:unnamed protein product [Brassicogethes aeneus]|uniref:Uncharacterized protein n=1 Tax=Brassicogethes aeneus TaxID=1431903 RepID=A0A9P0FIT4_BRAAE|nr:unnamed protein product [Brassicogethes aeneus]